MIDIIANSKSAALKAYSFALGATKTTNGRNAMLMGGANMAFQYGRSRHEDRPFGLYGAAKSFGLGAMGGYYGGIALRVGNRGGWRGGLGGLAAGMQGEFGRSSSNWARRNHNALRSIRNTFF